ncbi:hypothetical protein AOQ71_23820 [Bradyrhizobium manausense]|jgi:hypothetical protein|uniref:Uncharacterized protein n=2 Tax=Nitrobacteraceae TaxID=41294 RepID=A0A0R3DBG8_9BRAD|nr:hypothetical protein AOQ71_23820 [Bradyrhizobium manausense]
MTDDRFMSLAERSTMSKRPSIQHEYHPKRDRLEITIKHFSLTKKSEREDLVKYLLQKLTGGTDIAKKLKRAKNPWKETRIPEVGD